MASYDDWGESDQALFLGMGSTSTYDQPVTAQTVTSSLATQGQGITDTGLGQWGGFLQNVGKTLLTYTLAKDQMETQAEIAKSRYGMTGLQPVYASTSAGLAISPMLLIGLAVVAVVLLKD